MKKAVEDFWFWRLLLRLERFILVFTSVAAMLCIVSSALMRYIFQSDLYGIEEIIILMAIWLYFIGGAYGSYENSHISADMVSHYIDNESLKKIIRLAAAVVTLICTAIFSKWSLDWLAFSLRINDSSVSLHLPMIAYRLPIALCFILSFFYGLYHLINVALNRQPLTRPSED